MILDELYVDLIRWREHDWLFMSDIICFNLAFRMLPLKTRRRSQVYRGADSAHPNVHGGCLYSIANWAASGLSALCL